jgi:hypothetical protein
MQIIAYSHELINYSKTRSKTATTLSLTLQTFDETSFLLTDSEKMDDASQKIIE